MKLDSKGNQKLSGVDIPLGAATAYRILDTQVPAVKTQRSLLCNCYSFPRMLNRSPADKPDCVLLQREFAERVISHILSSDWGSPEYEKYKNLAAGKT